RRHHHGTAVRQPGRWEDLETRAVQLPLHPFGERSQPGTPLSLRATPSAGRAESAGPTPARTSARGRYRTGGTPVNVTWRSTRSRPTWAKPAAGAGVHPFTGPILK